MLSAQRCLGKGGGVIICSCHHFSLSSFPSFHHFIISSFPAFVISSFHRGAGQGSRVPAKAQGCRSAGQAQGCWLGSGVLARLSGVLVRLGGESTLVLSLGVVDLVEEHARSPVIEGGFWRRWFRRRRTARRRIVRRRIGRRRTCWRRIWRRIWR